MADNRSQGGPFQAKPIYRELAERLFVAAAELERGGILAYERIESLINCKRHINPWGSIIKKWKALMLDRRRIDIYPAFGVGYRLIDEEEQVTEAVTRRRRCANNWLAKAGKAVRAALEVEDLSANLRHIAEEQREKLHEERRRINANERRIAVLGRKRELPK